MDEPKEREFTAFADSKLSYDSWQQGCAEGRTTETLKAPNSALTAYSRRSANDPTSRPIDVDHTMGTLTVHEPGAHMSRTGTFPGDKAR